jgi:uncharacterized protein
VGRPIIAATFEVIIKDGIDFFHFPHIEKLMQNIGTWFEIAATDIERAKTFYETAFSVSFTLIEMDGNTMYMFEYDPQKTGCGGAIVQGEFNTPNADGTILYFHSTNIDGDLEKVAAAGGTVVMPNTSIGEFGSIGMFLDTEGNRIGLHANS